MFGFCHSSPFSLKYVQTKVEQSFFIIFGIWNHFKVLWRLLVEECVPYICLWSHNFSKRQFSFEWVSFFLRLQKCTVFEQPTVDYEGVSRGRSVALQWHLNSALAALQRNFNATSMAQKKIDFFWPMKIFFGGNW